jgi:hypothetical protein
MRFAPGTAPEQKGRFPVGATNEGYAILPRVVTGGACARRTQPVSRPFLPALDRSLCRLVCTPARTIPPGSGFVTPARGQQARNRLPGLLVTAGTPGGRPITPGTAVPPTDPWGPRTERPTAVRQCFSSCLPAWARDNRGRSAQKSGAARSLLLGPQGMPPLDRGG